MAHLIADRVKETSTTTGTGNLTLAGAMTGFQAFSAVYANNDTFFYTIENQSAGEWEVGLGTYVSATPAIARTSILESSNSDAAVNFSAGTKIIWVAAPAITLNYGTITASPSANQNNYNPSNLKYSNVLRLTPTADIIITGLAGGYEGRRIRIENDSTDYMVILSPQNTSSSASNRFTHSLTNFPLIMLPNDWAEYVYDNTDARWELTNSTREPTPPGSCDRFTDLDTGDAQGTTSGTGASTQTGTYLVNSTEKPFGVWQTDTGTTATGRAHIGSSSNNSLVPAQGCALFLCRLAVEQTSTSSERFQIFAGFHDAQGSTNVTDGVYWTYRDEVSANWLRGSAAASTRTETASGVTVDTNYIWLGIFLNANWTRAAYFYSTNSLDWTIDGTNTTNLPSSTQLVSWAVGINKTVGTTQRNLSIDLMGYRLLHQRG
jgi:hypothetical protein